MNLRESAMEDRLEALEKRLSYEAGAACMLPSTEFLLVKLDQIDVRLRQLEEKQKQPESYFAADLNRQHQFRSLSSALHEAHLKGTLMERLQFLETRIRQLSYELDKSSGTCSAATRKGNDMGWLQPVGPEMPVDHQRHEIALCSNQTKAAAKDSKEVMDAMEKRASAMCRSEKRRMERTRLYKKWFPVGC